MRTIAYVDGYNFYHGRLKHSPYKWLDLRSLLHELIRIQDPSCELASIKFFSASIKARLARRGADSVNAQEAYHRTLAARGVEIILGAFSLVDETAPRYVEGQPPNRDDRIRIWSLEEKQTDVKLALQMYRDLRAGRCDQLVLCTNDSDLAPALQAIREDYPSVTVGVVLPRPPDLKARGSRSLEELAHWTRHHIRDEELAAHQLPDRVGTRKKPVDKPAHW
jgi:uncharacterized LabA/DUF88 family protein